MMGTLARNQTGDSPLMLLPANEALSLALTMPAEGMAVLINNRLEHCVQELGVEAACSLLIKLCAQCAPTKWGRLAPAVKSAVVKVVKLLADHQLDSNQALASLKALASMNAVSAEKTHRHPSWLQKRWIQRLLQQVLVRFRDSPDMLRELLQAISRLRYVPSQQEVESLNHVLSRVAGRMPADKLKENLGVEKRRHNLDKKRTYNFDQLVEALNLVHAGAQNTENITSATTDTGEAQESEISCEDTLVSCSVSSPRSLCVSTGQSSQSTNSAPPSTGIATHGSADEHGAAEMFGRRKLQLVLDISRVADIKFRAAQGEYKRFIPFSCPQLAQSCSWSVLSSSSVGSGKGDVDTQGGEMPQWLKAELGEPLKKPMNATSARAVQRADRRVQLTCKALSKDDHPASHGLLLSFNTTGVATGTVLKAAIKMKFDGSTVVVRPRTVTMNIEVHVDTDPLRMKNTAGVLHITEDPVEMIVYDDETRPQARNERTTPRSWGNDSESLEADVCAVLAMTANLMLHEQDAAGFDKPLPIPHLERHAAIHARAQQLHLQWAPAPLDLSWHQKLSNLKMLLLEVSVMVHNKACMGELATPLANTAILLQNLYQIACRHRLHSPVSDEMLDNAVSCFECTGVLLSNVGAPLMQPFASGILGPVSPPTWSRPAWEPPLQVPVPPPWAAPGAGWVPGVGGAPFALNSNYCDFTDGNGLESCAPLASNGTCSDYQVVPGKTLDPSVVVGLHSDLRPFNVQMQKQEAMLNTPGASFSRELQPFTAPYGVTAFGSEHGLPQDCANADSAAAPNHRHLQGGSGAAINPAARTPLTQGASQGTGQRGAPSTRRRAGRAGRSRAARTEV